MELDYVVVDDNVIKEEPKIQRVQTKKVQQDLVTENTPEKITEEQVVEDIPAQSADIINSIPVSEPVKQKSNDGQSAQTPIAVQRIGTTAELDNTEFVPLFNPKPDYPVVAQVSQITGWVDVDLVINVDGKVESFTIIETKGHPSFAVETAKVLPRWRFPPPRIGGKKVRVQYTYRVNFTLN
jgi:protein TonB